MISFQCFSPLLCSERRGQPSCLPLLFKHKCWQGLLPSYSLFMEPEDNASRSNNQAIAAKKKCNALIPCDEHYKERSPESSFVSLGTLMDFSLLRLRNWPHAIKSGIWCAISLKQRLKSMWTKSNYFQFSRFVFSANPQDNTLPCTGLSVLQYLFQMAISDVAV